MRISLAASTTTHFPTAYEIQVCSVTAADTENLMGLDSSRRPATTLCLSVESPCYFLLTLLESGVCYRLCWFLELHLHASQPTISVWTTVVSASIPWSHLSLSIILNTCLLESLTAYWNRNPPTSPKLVKMQQTVIDLLSKPPVENYKQESKTHLITCLA